MNVIKAINSPLAFNYDAGVSPFANTKSLLFDGMDGYLDCGNDSSINISGDLTLSAWVFIPLSASFGFYGIFSKIDASTRNYELLIRGNEQLSFYTSNTEFTTSTSTIPLNTWTHVMVTVNSGVAGGVKFYFNGVLDATTGTQTVVAQPHNLNIGRRSTDSFYLNGNIDEPCIFNRVVTPAEIVTLSTAPTVDLTSLNPIAWYRNGDNGSYKSPQWLIPSNENKDKVSNYSMNLDGANDYVNSNYMATTSLYTSGFTISAWVNPDTLTNRSIVGQYDGANRFYFRLYDAKYWVGFGSWNGGIGATAMDSTVQTGIWQNIILTYNPSDTTLRTYRNGIFEGSQFKDLSVLGVPTSPLNIGNSDNNGYFDGNMSDVAIFPRVVTPSEITTISTTPTDLTPLNPIAWWKMGEEATFSTNWTIPDEVGTSTGTSVNMTIEDRVGDAPSSTNNAVSLNMDFVDVVLDTPPTP
jgi:hypothetical protein